jgi:hypothetical protein
MASSEGQTLANTKADEIAQLGWRELDAYGERTEQIHSPSRRIFRVTSRVYWDMEPWASGINISVKARPDGGLRRLWRNKAWRVRGGPDDPVPPPP